MYGCGISVSKYTPTLPSLLFVQLVLCLGLRQNLLQFPVGGHLLEYRSGKGQVEREVGMKDIKRKWSLPSYGSSVFRGAQTDLDNIKTANELASYVELGESGPVAERLQALADLIICQNVKG